MQTTRRLRTAVATLAIGTACATAPTAIAVPPGGPDTQTRGAKVKLASASVRQGGRIKVSGTNWKARTSRLTGKAEVTIKIDDADILAILPIRNKRFSGWVRIPTQIKAGRHWLRFLASDPATSVKSRAFTVKRR
jgi:hypothetical protein